MTKPPSTLSIFSQEKARHWCGDQEQEGACRRVQIAISDNKQDREQTALRFYVIIP